MTRIVAAVGAIALAVLGLLSGRPDIAAIGLPLGLWAVLAERRERAAGDSVEVSLTPIENAERGRIDSTISVSSDAEMVLLQITQSERRRRDVVVAGHSSLASSSRSLHSGPIEELRIDARGVSVDGAALSDWMPTATAIRNVAPTQRTLQELPLAPRLTGLHGGHEGHRPGQGGDFRDIHAFAPGDELRRVDWRATARLARRPGELYVRRTQSLSDASFVIMMDTVDDLGEVVGTWGRGDLERSGVTSLDNAREAARSLAASAIAAGDQVAFHALVQGGRSVRSGAGSRHLARLVATISATGEGGDDVRFRRTPPVPHGSVIFVLSTFFDGAAAALALRWRASGHRVIGIDTLPTLDMSRLSPEQHVAVRVLMAERGSVFGDLRGAGIDVLPWTSEAAALTGLRQLARTRA